LEDARQFSVPINRLNLEARGDLTRSLGIELPDIGPDGLKMRQGRLSPDNLVQRGSGFGQANSSAVPQESSHLATLACGTYRPARYAAIASASRRASSAASSSKIDLISVFATQHLPPFLDYGRAGAPCDKINVAVLGRASEQAEHQKAADHTGGQQAGDQGQPSLDEVAHRGAEEPQ